ncbi:MAG: MBL fold metallo-hydrolase [Gemmatimonadaceae bacterium]|nr:MBL fold metallo-hydrolase [Gemmatimonadaceae bacterium]
MRVHRLPLDGTNAYVISGEHHVLVDTGPARSRTQLLDALAGLGLGGDDLSLVLATHAHATSVGNAAYLQRMFHVPLAVHGADAPILASGLDRAVGFAKPLGSLMRWFGDSRFEAAPPDVVFGHTLSLHLFGTEGTVVHTPGHTIGSASVVLPTGDAIVGDLLMGGWFGGRLLPRRPARHYLAEMPQRVARSLALLNRLGVQRLHPGTGDVLQMDDVRDLIIARAGDAPSGPAPARVRERRLRQDPALHSAA